jgi:tetratricopeptide (TPR) repeat protein
MRVRRTRAALSGAALVAALIASGSAAASDTVIGGGAEACSVAAKAGLASPAVLENCTLAILSENLQGHLLAATYVNRGTVYMALMNWGSALSDFDRALEVEPTMAEAWVNRGGALVGLKRFKEAEENIDKGLALMPEEPEKAYGNRALARWSMDNLKGAYDDFQMALMLKPDWAWPKEQLTAFNVETANVKTAPGPNKP